MGQTGVLQCAHEMCVLHVCCHREDAEPVRAMSGNTCCCGPASRGEGFRADTTSACLHSQGGWQSGDVGVRRHRCTSPILGGQRHSSKPLSITCPVAGHACAHSKQAAGEQGTHRLKAPSWWAIASSALASAGVAGRRGARGRSAARSRLLLLFTDAVTEPYMCRDGLLALEP